MLCSRSLHCRDFCTIFRSCTFYRWHVLLDFLILYSALSIASRNFLILVLKNKLPPFAWFFHSILLRRLCFHRDIQELYSIAVIHGLPLRKSPFRMIRISLSSCRIRLSSFSASCRWLTQSVLHYRIQRRYGCLGL